MVELGVMLATAAGVAKDEAQARALFERAAQAGNPRGATNLAALAAMGGAPADPARSRALLERTAQTNSPEALYQLGLMTAEGLGGPKDDVAARALFERAAAQGHPGALELMGAFARAGAAVRRTPTPPNKITRRPRRSAMMTPRRRSSGRNAPT